MTQTNNVDPKLLQAMRKAIENIKNQSPEELAANIKKHQDGPISTALNELSGFATLNVPNIKQP
jgi:hypothetical protein